MDENQNNKTNLIDTTDCLEAVGVFRGWKNLLFIVTLLCLLLLQVSFWVLDRGLVKDEPVVQTPIVTKAAEPNTPAPEHELSDANETAAIVVDSNHPTEAQTQPKKVIIDLNLKTQHMNWLIRVLNFVLIAAAVLYCLAILFSLKVSLLGRLGGINHISRAFFLSLLMVVFLLPWQRLFGGVIVGAMYTPDELLKALDSVKDSDIVQMVLHYLRYTGYWLLIVLWLILAQIRSCRWTRTILRRLEVI
ncbi:hypothetical protein ACFL3G_04805 [Planctomycetota bacterium]